MGDKRQITGTYCVSMTGVFLPLQIIYQGKTKRCHPKQVKFLDGFHVTQTENHWSNEKVHLAYLKKTVIPYIEKVRKTIVTQTENHWSNEKVHLAYLKKTVISYIEKVRKTMNLKEDQKALLIYDVFRGKTTGAVTDTL